jgi:hypothetical protein
MNKKQLQARFIEWVGPTVIPFGFQQRSEDQFSRSVSDVEHILSVGPMKTSGGYRLTSGAAGIRISRIEALMRPESDSLTTVGIPVHLLRPERSYREWRFSTEKEMQGLVRFVTEDLEQYAVPFLDKFPDAASIRRSLESENPADWFMLDRGARDARRVFFAFLEEGRESALRLGAMLLEEQADKPDKYSIDLRKAIRRVEGF